MIDNQTLTTIREATADLDAHDRKEVYWAIICRLAETQSMAVREAVTYVQETYR